MRISLTFAWTMITLHTLALTIFLRAGAAVGILFGDEATSFWTVLFDSWWVGLVALAVLILLASIFRQAFLVRLPIWIMTHTLYRVRAHGVENIPESGSALLVA